MIKLILLTGFLGTGKTTLLKSILEEYDDRKIGIIVNDFGAINIDAKLVRKNGVPMAELSNGSIFCACIKDNFLKSLIEMSALDIEYLFIEASGLADPASMGNMLSYISFKLIKQYDYIGSICVIDAKTFIELYKVLPALHNQIIYSNLIIINKSDLVDEERLIDLNEKIIEVNPSASIIITAYCKLDIEKEINSLLPVAAKSMESTNKVETKPKTLVISSKKIISFDKLELFLNELSKSTFRVKGFAKTDKGNFEISCVGDEVNIYDYANNFDNDIEETQFIVISKIGIKIISEITSLSSKHLDNLLSIN